jgi:hypothetical protein
MGKIDSSTGPLQDISNRLIAQTNQPRKLILKQLTEALRTGGVKAKIPLIQQAVSAANRELGGSLARTSEQLAARNIGGPFAQRILAQNRVAGEQGIAAIPTQTAEQLISQFTPFLASTQALGVSALSQIAQLKQAADMFNQGSIPFSRTGQTGLLGGICLHPDTCIDTPTGPIPVDELLPGDVVWTLGEGGEKRNAFVVRTTKQLAPGHKVLRIEAPNGPILVSAGHPLPDGTPIGEVYHGEEFPLDELYTCDIAVSGPSGIYYTNGLALGSTIDDRFARREQREAATRSD